MQDTFSITYRHRDGSISRQTQEGDSATDIIARHGPEGATVVAVTMRCRAIRPTTGARCGRFSAAGELCHLHAPRYSAAANPLTPFHRGEV